MRRVIVAKEVCEMKKLMFVAGLVASLGAFGEIQIINGMKVECVDGVCRIIEEDVDEGNERPSDPRPPRSGCRMSPSKCRVWKRRRSRPRCRP